MRKDEPRSIAAAWTIFVAGVFIFVAGVWLSDSLVQLDRETTRDKQQRLDDLMERLAREKAEAERLSVDPFPELRG